MDFMRMRIKDMQVLMLTSFNPGAGKTFVSTNLALSLAFSGKRVVLIDLDIRKCTLSKHLSEDKRLGVTDFLSEKTDKIFELLQRNELSENLYVIPAGLILPNPTQMLTSERLEQLIAHLRKQFDYVILDSVPYSMVADASIVNRVADLTLFIIRAGLMDKRMLPEVEKIYNQNKLKNMSVILNAVDYKRSGYGYGHYGYGAYGYGYGDKA
jgi:capsular exopolysaccharide synthesis family protein